MLMSACVSSQPGKCDKYYFMVMSGDYDTARDQEEVILCGVAELNKPFTFCSTYKSVNGILSQGQNDLIHFKGSVQIGTMGAGFDTDLTVDVGQSPKLYSFSGTIGKPFYIQIKPIPATLQNVLRMPENQANKIEEPNQSMDPTESGS